MKLAVLNTSIVTADGMYSYGPIAVDEARALVAEAMAGDGIDSAFGHEGSAPILSDLLGVEIPINRQALQQQPGQKALVFKLRGRGAEGEILDRARVEEIGYDLKLLTRFA